MRRISSSGRRASSARGVTKVVVVPTAREGSVWVWCVAERSVIVRWRAEGGAWRVARTARGRDVWARFGRRGRGIDDGWMDEVEERVDIARFEKVEKPREAGCADLRDVAGASVQVEDGRLSDWAAVRRDMLGMGVVDDEDDSRRVSGMVVSGTMVSGG